MLFDVSASRSPSLFHCGVDAPHKDDGSAPPIIGGAPPLRDCVCAAAPGVVADERMPRLKRLKTAGTRDGVDEDVAEEESSLIFDVGWFCLLFCWESGTNGGREVQ
jgi:hypothetical protein